MVFDVVLKTTSSDATFRKTYYLKAETLEYSIDRRIKVYELPLVKSLTLLSGGKLWSNFCTDWGQCVEDFTLSGVINEGTKYASLVKMMEMGFFVRSVVFAAQTCRFYAGADPNEDPTDLTKYAVIDDGKRVMGEDEVDPTNVGIEVKVTKMQFKHTGNTPYISWTMQMIAAHDFELVG